MEIKTAKRLEGIGEYYFSQKLREIEQLNKGGKNIINLGIGSPDQPPHQSVISVLEEEAGKPNVHGYQGYKGVADFRIAIADFYCQWYHVTLNADTEILPLIGSKEGIMHICMTYLNEGDEVLIPNPGYPTYRSAVTLAGGVCKEYNLKEENNWYPDFEELEKQDLSKVKLMWMNYPHMPTGTLPTEDLFKQIIAFGKKHNILVCHDNPYSFILNNNPISILSVEGAMEVAIELNSLSKASNMAGWRVGWMAGKKERIDEVLRFKSNMDSGMFQPVQRAAIAALKLDKDWYESLNKQYAERRELVFEILAHLKCVPQQGQVGLFVWAKVAAEYTNGYALSDKALKEHNVFITPGGIFGTNGNNYVRISLCANTTTLQKALDQLKQ
ncbi:MAG: aminotransferase class I/II-fold pyridoxal phosphate-dependent enzyme [Segetibacter sp.]|nr:aminotransferase class I/II-fold pyridoxal phosphate-dependent enzyme [Segetibacter sp.]